MRYCHAIFEIGEAHHQFWSWANNVQGWDLSDKFEEMFFDLRDGESNSESPFVEYLAFDKFVVSLAMIEELELLEMSEVKGEGEKHKILKLGSNELAHLLKKLNIFQMDD